MIDPRFTKLAELLVRYSTRVRRGERVLLELSDTPDEFAVELMRAVRRARALPFVLLRHGRVSREILMGVDAGHARAIRDIELFRMTKMNAYIAVRGAGNVCEISDVPQKRVQLFTKILRPVSDRRINKTRWCVLRWPTPSMAQSARMSTEAFENFYFDVCTMDYAKMAKAMAPLQRRMARADRVHIKAPGTDLRFSIKGLGAIMCKGDFNIPDGEVFSCPVKESVEGVIRYNAPTVYSGARFEKVRLVFKKGRIVEASGSDAKRLNQILDTDPGARYVGEFSIACNPLIREPMGDILFDEKIAGSLHVTPGQAYELADNGNRSAVHWDLVLIQRPEWGGGEIWFDGELIRRNGKFVPADLRGLNPERLL